MVLDVQSLELCLEGDIKWAATELETTHVHEPTHRREIQVLRAQVVLASFFRDGDDFGAHVSLQP